MFLCIHIGIGCESVHEKNRKLRQFYDTSGPYQMSSGTGFRYERTAENLETLKYVGKPTLVMTNVFLLQFGVSNREMA